MVTRRLVVLLSKADLRDLISSPYSPELYEELNGLSCSPCSSGDESDSGSDAEGFGEQPTRSAADDVERLVCLLLSY